MMLCLFIILCLFRFLIPLMKEEEEEEEEEEEAAVKSGASWAPTTVNSLTSKHD